MRCAAWLTDTLQRQFPLGENGRKKTLLLACARGERVSFQVSFRLQADDPVKISAKVADVKGVEVTVRRVGCVPMPHFNSETTNEERDGVGMIPGFVPDVLYPESVVNAAPDEVTSFWITVDVPAKIKSGLKDVAVELYADEAKKKLASVKATLQISKVVLKPRKNFHMTHWFYADNLCDWYKVVPFSKEFWPLCTNYVRNYAQHGNDTLYVPVFTQPLDGVKTPTQLLNVTRGKNGKYSFKWNVVKRWIAMARECGITHFEWTHLFSQWGCENAIRIYEGHGLDEKLLWPDDTKATSDTYRDFLSQFLPAFKKFLQKENLEDVSFFHISDEPHGAAHLENYKAARALIKELAPWMKVIDAISEIEFAREGLTDIPVPTIIVSLDFLKEGIDCWTYFCCGPRGKYLNRLLDTPLSKIRMAGWLFYRFGFGGFLHWGYNYWNKTQSRELIDPYQVSDAHRWPEWPYGDPFLVYPGPDGPLDSIRHELFFESMQDYALLQTLGVNPDDKTLAVMKSFEDFPKDGTWLKKMRKKLLT